MRPALHVGYPIVRSCHLSHIVNKLTFVFQSPTGTYLSSDAAPARSLRLCTSYSPHISIYNVASVRHGHVKTSRALVDLSQEGPRRGIFIPPAWRKYGLEGYRKFLVTTTG